ncbi:MAG TPA: hypothetical protein VGR27_02080 [Longimicrobiaceae bacterium]|nr:hypothetical protein [Longimicrobiaceae bacterium]
MATSAIPSAMCSAAEVVAWFDDAHARPTVNAGTLVDTVGARAGEYAGQASDALSRAAWWALLTLGLSLGAAVGGATIKARE